MALTGQVVEAVAGEPVKTFRQALILTPLGTAAITQGDPMARPHQPPLSRSYLLHGGVAHPAFRLEIDSFAPSPPRIRPCPSPSAPTTHPSPATCRSGRCSVWPFGRSRQ